MPKFVLDGKEIEFKQGQTIIQAAKDHGVTIPHFCWHESLSVAGNCRVCLVEIEKMPKLAIACSTTASEGMVVHTASEKALGARNAVMEFLLINHPLDCPICDEAGECKLQDYAYSHGVGESRFVEEKTHKDKRVPLGPFVMFDGDRCISCSRCIRFCDEIAKDSELTFIKRGDRVTITTFPGEELDNPYSLNVTDICPVGALTNRDFRFRARVWDMSANRTICQGCSRGCNIELWVRNNEILRITPRENKDVNSFWMCDYGRINTFKFVNDESRVNGPLIRKDGMLVKSEWNETLKHAASELKKYQPNEIAFIGSAFATLEDNYLFVKLAKSLSIKNIDFVRHYNPSFADDILRKEDMTPNSIGAEAVGVKPLQGGLNIDGIINGIKERRIKALFVIEEDIVSDYPELEEQLANLDLVIINSTNFNKTTDIADVVFPAAAYAEKNGTMVNSNGRVQRLKPAVTTIDADRALDGLEMSRLDKFGTKYDRWAQGTRYDTRSSWKILSALSAELGFKLKFNMAEEVFSDIAKNIKEFAGLDYDVIGELGAQSKLQPEEKIITT